MENSIFDCCRKNRAEDLRTLINENPQNVNARDSDQCTPLHVAACYNSVECLQILIQSGAVIGVENEFEVTPLHYAVSHSSIECLQILIQSGANINAKNVHGDTALHHAAYRSSIECLQILLQSSADTSIKNNDGHTFLDCIRDEQVQREIEEYINALSTLDVKEPAI